ncbi:MAG: hypothetical protein QF827_04345 [Alphaproteobacteria bacterium]|nr:hypothetical protein [Alphaproteobacteria bacterium]
MADNTAAPAPRGDRFSAYLVYVLYALGYVTGLGSLAAVTFSDGLHLLVVVHLFDCDALVPACAASVYGVPYFSGVTSLAALILAYIKRAEARGGWLESHHTWQIMIFWYWLAIGFVGVILLLAYVLFGYVLVLGAIWGVYRIVKGWRLLNRGRPIENPTAFL